VNGRPAKRVVGIDPGLKGALAFLDYDGDIKELEDMPVIGNEVNAHMISRLIQGYGPVDAAVVERAQSMPKQGISGAFNYGTGYGKILGVLATLDIPLVLLSPSDWKKKFNLGKDKNLARQRASERWPEWSGHFAKVKDDGRAEAALMTLSWLQSRPGPRIIKRRLEVP
jgi:crossover junction endodeoxyribonuclease RuvC